MFKEAIRRLARINESDTRLRQIHAKEDKSIEERTFSQSFCWMILAGEVGLLVARESLFVSEDRL